MDTTSWRLALALTALVALAQAENENAIKFRERYERDCMIGDYTSPRVVVNAVDVVACMTRGRCYDFQRRECYLRESDPCYLPYEEDRMYHDIKEPDQCDQESACLDRTTNKCYMKRTDACYIPNKDDRIPIQGCGNEETCERAEGCFHQGECYMKDFQCIKVPDNCEVERTFSCDIGDKECGPGMQRERWSCCAVGDKQCAPRERTMAWITKPCCEQACPGPMSPAALEALDAVVEAVEAKDWEKLEGIVGRIPGAYFSPVPGIEVIMPGGIAVAADGKKFTPCQQTMQLGDKDEPECERNGFFEAEREDRPDWNEYRRHVVTYVLNHDGFLENFPRQAQQLMEDRKQNIQDNAEGDGGYDDTSEQPFLA